MTLVKFYVYKCNYCQVCVHTYIKKDKCIKCGHEWEIEDSFNLQFPNKLYEDL